MADIGKAERDDMRRHARGVISEPNYRVDIPKLLDALEAAEKERDALRRHYDAAAPERNLLGLLDLYEERRREAATKLRAAEAELARLRPLVEAAEEFARATPCTEAEIIACEHLFSSARTLCGAQVPDDAVLTLAGEVSGG